MRQMLYGTLCGVAVFLALSWVSTSRTVRAAVPTAPPEGRFELIQLHPSHDEQWSGILDTETGCVWVYASQTPADISKVANPSSWAVFQNEEGSNFFGPVSFDPSSYTTPKASNSPAGTVDASPLSEEIERVNSLCDRSRVQALEAAAAR